MKAIIDSPSIIMRSLPSYLESRQVGNNTKEHMYTSLLYHYTDLFGLHNLFVRFGTL